MSKVLTALSTSVDGFIAGAHDSPQQPLGNGGEQLFAWLFDGDTPSKHAPGFRMSAVSAAPASRPPAQPSLGSATR